MRGTWLDTTAAQSCQAFSSVYPHRPTTGFPLTNSHGWFVELDRLVPGIKAVRWDTHFFQGFKTRTPKSAKSLTLRVTITKSWWRAVAAISPSATMSCFPRSRHSPVKTPHPSAMRGVTGRIRCASLLGHRCWIRNALRLPKSLPHDILRVTEGTAVHPFADQRFDIGTLDFYCSRALGEK